MKFIQGPYHLDPIYIDGKPSMKLNIGSIVYDKGIYYIIREDGLEEIKWIKK